MDPAYTGVLGHYINLGEFYDRKTLRPMAKEFTEIMVRYRGIYAKAYQSIRAAKEVRNSGEAEVHLTGVLDKVSKRAKGILSREVKRKRGQLGQVKNRFLGAISCDGVLCLYGTIYKQSKRIYELQDFGGLAHYMISDLQEAIVKAGYDVVAYHSPEDPDRVDHLVVPELSLAFVTTTSQRGLDRRPYRRIRMESMMDKQKAKATKAKLRLSQRIANELLEDGIVERSEERRVGKEC